MSAFSCQSSSVVAVRVRGSRVRRLCRRPNRRGATLIETAITILIFLTLVLGMLDLGIAVFRHQMLSHAARQLARQAIVHGELADRLGEWGPATFSGAANDSNPITSDLSDGQSLADYLVGLDPASVTVLVEWLQGNALESPVRVTLTSPYQPIVTFIFGNPTITLSAVSEMQIAH